MMARIDHHRLVEMHPVVRHQWRQADIDERIKHEEAVAAVSHVPAKSL